MADSTRCHTASDSPIVHAADVQACGRWVGETHYWDINGETIRDDDLRQWARAHFPESSCWANTATGVLTYHVVAWAHRRRAITEFMRTVKWQGREALPDEQQS